LLAAVSVLLVKDVGDKSHVDEATL